MQECGAGWRKVPLVEVKKQRELHKRSSAKIALVQPRGGKRGWYLALISPPPPPPPHQPPPHPLHCLMHLYIDLEFCPLTPPY